MTWPVVPLGDIATVVSGATPKTEVPDYWGGSVRWATPKDLSALTTQCIADTPRKLTDAGLRSCAATVLPPGSVLLSSRAPIGHVAINTVPMATNQGFKNLVPGDRLHAGYIFHWLRAHRPLLESLGNGATFKELSKATVTALEIPLPSMIEQRRIADILDRAEALCTTRLASTTLLDEFAESCFVDLFGHPLTNPRSFPLAQLKSLGKVVTGRTPTSDLEGAFGGPIPFITPGDLGRDRPSLRTLSELGAKRSVLVRAGSTLVCCIGATIGKVGQASVSSAFNQQINAVEWGPDIADAYGWASLKACSKVIAQQGTSTTMPILNKSSFERLEIPIPPRDLQDAFSARVTACRGAAASIRRQLIELDSLTTALQQRAFRGEL